MSTSFNPNIPADTDTVYDAYFSFRSNMLGLNNLIGVDHVDGTDANSAQHGMHKQVTFATTKQGTKEKVLTLDDKNHLVFDSRKFIYEDMFKSDHIYETTNINDTDSLKMGYLFLPYLRIYWLIKILRKGEKKKFTLATSLNQPALKFRDVQFAFCWPTNVINSKFTFDNLNVTPGGLNFTFNFKDSTVELESKYNTSIGVAGIIID